MEIQTSEQQKDVKKSAVKKPRKRMKATYTKIREQMEFYFSDASLHKDRFLKKTIEATPDGYVGLDVFVKFNKIKCYTEDTDVIAEAINNKSDILQVNPERTHVRRVTQIKEPVNVDQRTVYVECLPLHANHDWVKKLFSSCGKVVYVSLPRYQSTGDLKGFGFVEFETIQGAQAACEELNNPPAGHKVGMFPKTSHQLDSLKKKLPDQLKDMGTKLKETESPDCGEKIEIESESGVNAPKEGLVDKAVKDTSKAAKSKRRRTKSENDASCSSESSPAKRKKAEVSFELPPDEEKTSSGSKKKSRKRRNKSRSAESEDSKGESDLDKSDSIPEKKQKTTSEEGDLETEGSGEPNQSGELGDMVAQQNKENTSGKRKRFRRKKDKKEKEFPELRVLPKKEWLMLREEYLDLQKKSMASLKETLKQHTCSKTVASVKQKMAEIEFIPDVIVKVSCEHPMLRKNLKSVLGDGYQIAYIDVKDDQTAGHIRCKEAESAKRICASSFAGYKFSLVSGDEEKQYWDKLSADRTTKWNTKGRHGKQRGQQKWTNKAQKVSIENTEGKHIVFDDD